MEVYYSLILEKNKPDQRITAELPLFCIDDLELIFRDDGKILDPMDRGMALTSLGSYALSRFQEKIDLKEHVSSLSYNRSRFVFEHVHDVSQEWNGILNIGAY